MDFTSTKKLGMAFTQQNIPHLKWMVISNQIQNSKVNNLVKSNQCNLFICNLDVAT